MTFFDCEVSFTVPWLISLNRCLVVSVSKWSCVFKDNKQGSSRSPCSKSLKYLFMSKIVQVIEPFHLRNKETADIFCVCGPQLNSPAL